MNDLSWFVGGDGDVRFPQIWVRMEETSDSEKKKKSRVSTEDELGDDSSLSVNGHDDNPNGNLTIESLQTQNDDALARGLSSILSTVISDFDSKAQDTLISQHHLSSTLDRLTGELDKLLEDAPLPFIMQYAAKISTVRKRVSSLNSLLKSIQRRVDNMDRMLSVSILQDKTAPECTEHQSHGKEDLAKK